MLDLFCGAGGAAMGYHRAGFDVIGVDVKQQPNYPFEFVQADALDVLAEVAGGAEWFPQPSGLVEWPKLHSLRFDAIHASPPCQRYSGISAVYGAAESHPDLVEPTRTGLRETGLAYVIENVVGAPLIEPVMLCGSALGLPLKRHRLFEASFPLMSPGCAHGAWPKQYRIRQHGKEFDTAFCYVFGGGQAGQPVAAWRAAMDIDWMTVDELSQAIPPAYTEHIGGYLLQHIQTKAAA